MKRSEAILKIEERIYCEIGPIIDGEDVKYSVYNTAISILDLIEELGMLPPDTEFREADYNKPEWEPEDD